MFKKLNDLKKSKKGFTLVELIVVLVILAILAAILVPTLLGYIDKARSEKDYATAQTVRVAAQAALDEMYGKSVALSTAKDTAKAPGTGDFTNTETTYGAEVKTLSGATYTSFSFTVENYKITSGSVVINNSTYYLTTTESGNSWTNSKA
jgi:prepilin-type N-terminal cleavage/methylation domain-containing protein